MSKKSLTPTAIGILGVIVVITLIGVFAVTLLRPDASAVLINLLVSAGGFITIAAGFFLAQSKTNDTVEEVKKSVEVVQKQTNGNTTRLQEQNEYLTDIVASNTIDPETLTRREYREQAS